MNQDDVVSKRPRNHRETMPNGSPPKPSETIRNHPETAAKPCRNLTAAQERNHPKPCVYRHMVRFRSRFRLQDGDTERLSELRPLGEIIASVIEDCAARYLAQHRREGTS